MVRAVALTRLSWSKPQSSTLPDKTLWSGAKMPKWNLAGKTVLAMASGPFCQSPMMTKGCLVPSSRAKSLAMMAAFVLLEVFRCGGGRFPQLGLWPQWLAREMHDSHSPGWCGSQGPSNSWKPTMGPTGVTVGERWSSKGSSTPYAEVLAELFMPLRIEVRFNENVDLSFPGPVPVNDL